MELLKIEAVKNEIAAENHFVLRQVTYSRSNEHYVLLTLLEIYQSKNIALPHYLTFQQDEYQKPLSSLVATLEKVRKETYELMSQKSGWVPVMSSLVFEYAGLNTKKVMNRKDQPLNKFKNRNNFSEKILQYKS